jgi:phosphomannomutase/phosphoglucomutase
VIAGDGRALASELVAAAGEGLRWAGCDVLELGAATAAMTTFAIGHAQADGGVLVGNPPGKPHTVGLRLWGDGPHPLSAGGRLFAVREIFERGPDRPTRSCGSSGRIAVEKGYLARLRPLFHALRPLRYVLATSCPSIPRHLASLSENVACEAILWPGRPNPLAEQVCKHGAHFGVRIEDDAQQVRLVDERGSAVAAQRLTLLLAGQWLEQHPQAAVVVERDGSPWLSDGILARGGRPVPAAPTRSGIDLAMRSHHAVFGGGAGARYWHRFDEGVYLPDGLLTLARLLVLFSRSDRPVSRVLDEDAPVD